MHPSLSLGSGGLDLNQRPSDSGTEVKQITDYQSACDVGRCTELVRFEDSLKMHSASSLFKELSRRAALF